MGKKAPRPLREPLGTPPVQQVATQKHFLLFIHQQGQGLIFYKEIARMRNIRT